jgi:hypothetical protein
MKRISEIWKRQPTHVAIPKPLMLAGICQGVFLNQWGKPDIRINLDHVGDFYKRKGMGSDADSSADALHSVWIYKEKDRIFFFTKRKLVSHFRWSDFRERRNMPVAKADTRFARKRPAGTVAILSLVA